MGIAELNSCGRLASFPVSQTLRNNTNSSIFLVNSSRLRGSPNKNHHGFSKAKIRAVGTKPESQSEPTISTSQEPHEVMINIAFINSVLLPDGTPDVQYLRARGGQKLRNIMLDRNVELYGPYSRPLLNCAGGGTCGTCIVEVVEGRELLTPRTDKEKEKLKRKPRNWRLACQTTLGKPDSAGLIVVQQLPEFKLHEWNYGKEPPPEDADCYYLD